MNRPGRADRLLVFLVAGIAALSLLLVGLATGPDEREEKAHGGSTHVASADGTRALFEYLSRAGFHPSTVETADLAVPDGAVLVVIASSLSEGEAAALTARVKAGLHLLLATDDASDPSFEALGMSVDADGGAGRAVAAWPSAMVKGVERVEVVSPLRAQPSAGWVELFADDAGAVASAKFLGAGEVVVLLDPAALTNDGLPRAGNLRFADAMLRHLAGPDGQVVFDEYHHGFGSERTIAGWFARAGLLPALWLLALVFGADALRKYGTRVGPPRPAPQPERRAIREFIAGHAGLLRAAGHRAWAAHALERSLRRRLRDELGVPPAAPPQEVFRRLAQRAPPSAARAYRALEHAASADDSMSEKALLDLARDVRLAERSLSTVRRRSR